MPAGFVLRRATPRRSRGLQAPNCRYSGFFAPFGLILPKVRAKGLFLPKSCRRTRARRWGENVGKVNSNCLQVVICQQFDRQRTRRENWWIGCVHIPPAATA